MLSESPAEEGKRVKTAAFGDLGEAPNRIQHECFGLVDPQFSDVVKYALARFAFENTGQMLLPLAHMPRVARPRSDLL